MPLRIPSPLSNETEVVIERVIGCGIEVHKALGPGLLESIYGDAMTIEMQFQGLTFERERAVPLLYRGVALRPHYVDLIVERSVVVELKAIERLRPVHGAQVLSYLQATGIRAGLLMNFNSDYLKNGLRRFVL
ncbi:MAG: GxxExxY protein [Vicinamibacterales bacterium]